MKEQDKKHLSKLIKPLQEENLVLPELDEHHHSTKPASIRHAIYKGKNVEIHTSYQYFVDGKSLELHTSVLNNGKVHCHSLPQYTFSSAVGMMKSVLDIMDIDEPENELSQYLHASADHMEHNHDS